MLRTASDRARGRVSLFPASGQCRTLDTNRDRSATCGRLFRMHDLPALSPLLLAIAGWLPVASARGQEPGLRAAVPEEAIVVVEMADPVAATRSLLQAVGGIPPGLKERMGVAAWTGLAAMWIAVDGDPEAFATQVAGGGAVLALVPDGRKPQAVLLLRPHDVPATERWCTKFAGKLPRQVVDGVLVLSADQQLVAATAARVARAKGRWADIDFGPAAAMRGAIDVAAIRRGLGNKAPTFASLEAGAKFLLLPFAPVVTDAAMVTFAVRGGDRLVVTATTANSVRTTPLSAMLPAAGQATEVPLPADGLASLRLDRSLRTLLQQPERLLKPAEVLSVQGFLSIADAIDGPHSSFVDDLVGGLGEPFTLLLLPITPPVDGPPSRLQLPGLALVARIHDPKAEKVLFRVAEAFGLIANTERSQRGQSPFPLRLRRSEAGRGLVGEPLPWRGPGAPPIEQGLSPTLWCENGHAVLASTYDAAMAALAAVRQAGTTPTEPMGDRLVLRGPAIGAAIAASRPVFELGRVLDEGEEPATATQFFDVLDIVANALHEVTFAVQCAATTTTVELSVERAR